MSLYAIFKTETGQIIKTVMCPEDLAPSQCEEDQSFVEVSSDIQDTTHYIDLDGTPQLLSTAPSHFHVYDYAQHIWVLDVEAGWREVRSRRDRLLTKCDWVVTKAAETSVPVPAEWSTYRQLLRNITEAESPDAVVWPTAPT